jgi:hypothetical protein
MMNTSRGESIYSTTRLDSVHSSGDRVRLASHEADGFSKGIVKIKINEGLYDHSMSQE